MNLKRLAPGRADDGGFVFYMYSIRGVDSVFWDFFWISFCVYHFGTILGQAFVLISGIFVHRLLRIGGILSITYDMIPMAAATIDHLHISLSHYFQVASKHSYILSP